MAYDFEFFPEIKFVQSINSSNEYEITSEFYHTSRLDRQQLPQTDIRVHAGNCSKGTQKMYVNTQCYGLNFSASSRLERISLTVFTNDLSFGKEATKKVSRTRAIRVSLFDILRSSLQMFSFTANSLIAFNNSFIQNMKNINAGKGIKQCQKQ